MSARGVLGLPAVILLLLAVAGCGSCPPAWSQRPPPDEGGWLYAAGRCGEVYVEAEARDVALTRAARVLADRLGLDVERRLSVVASGGRLFVEAVGSGGPLTELDGLQLADEALCDGVVHVLVRLRRP
jgi:hypothetical protein